MRRSRPTATLTCRRPPATAEMCRLASMTNRRKCHAGDRENLALAEQAHSGQRAGTVHVALITLVIRHLGGECPLGDARRCLVRARKAIRKFAVEAVLAPEVVVDSGLVHPCLGGIMGQFANGRLTNIAAMVATAVVLLLNVILILQTSGVPIPGLPA